MNLYWSKRSERMKCKFCHGEIPDRNKDLDGFCCIACREEWFKKHRGDPTYRIREDGGK
jgi:hypothetical protein